MISTHPQKSGLSPPQKRCQILAPTHSRPQVSDTYCSPKKAKFKNNGNPTQPFLSISPTIRNHPKQQSLSFSNLFPIHPHRLTRMIQHHKKTIFYQKLLLPQFWVCFENMPTFFSWQILGFYFFCKAR